MYTSCKEIIYITLIFDFSHKVIFHYYISFLISKLYYKLIDKKEHFICMNGIVNIYFQNEKDINFTICVGPKSEESMVQ